MRRRGNFNVFSAHAWYVPGVGGMLVLLLLVLGGALIGNFVTLIFTAIAGQQAAIDYAMLIAYPLQFLPAIMFVAIKSRNLSYSAGGFALDSSHFSPQKGWICALLVMAGTFAAAFATDALSSVMPPMPEWLKTVMENMTGGVLWVNFLLVSIMAPLFEEWLCRGMVLRGLLNAGKMKPVWAIVISALFFAIIHMNPWQAIPAFVLGLLFGYVYYKTGSLKLTMLMHFTNNTLALAASRIWPDAETWTDIIGAQYWPYFGLALVVLGLVVLAFSKIKPQSPEGSCDSVPSLFAE